MQKSAVEDCYKFYQAHLNGLFESASGGGGGGSGGNRGQANSAEHNAQTKSFVDAVSERRLSAWSAVSKEKALSLLGHLLQGLPEPLERSRPELTDLIERYYAAAADLNRQKIHLRLFNVQKALELKVIDELALVRLPVLSAQLVEKADSLTEVTPDARTVEAVPMSYSQPTPDEGVSAELVAPSTATGCTADEYDGVDATDKIAIVERGVCPFGDKAIAAKAAGADAVIIANNTDGVLNGTLGGVDEDGVPATGITRKEGENLLAKMESGPVTMKLVLTKTMEERQTFNVIAETDEGSSDDVVMVDCADLCSGADIDSR